MPLSYIVNFDIYNSILELVCQTGSTFLPITIVHPFTRGDYQRSMTAGISPVVELIINQDI